MMLGVGARALPEPSPSSSANKEEGKCKCVLYLICRCIGGPFVCKIFAIEVGGTAPPVTVSPPPPLPPQPLPKPVFGLHRDVYPGWMSYFSIGSRIYMIGGFRFVRTGRLAHIEKMQPVNEVYIYDTITSTVTQSAPMVYPKIDPLVIGPVSVSVGVPGSGSRKTSTNYYVLSQDLSEHDFEVFQYLRSDYSNRHLDNSYCRWTALTQPPVPHTSNSDYILRRLSGFDILAHAVVNDDVILLSTRSCGVFAYYISLSLWKCIASSPAKLPFFHEAVFFRSQAVYLAFSPYYVYTHIYALPATSPEKLVFSTWSDRESRDKLHVLRLHPLSSNHSSRNVIQARVGDWGLCTVRSGRDGSHFRTGTTNLAAINLFYPVTINNGATGAVELFSATYFIEEDAELRTVCACLPIFT